MPDQPAPAAEPAPAPQPAAPPAEAPAVPQAQTQSPAGPVAPPPQNPMNLYLMMGAMIAIFYFLMIRPQRKQEKARKAMLSALKKNDQVLTIGGVYGVVAAVTDDAVTLKIDEGKDVRIRVARGAVQTVIKQAKGGDEEKAD